MLNVSFSHCDSQQPPCGFELAKEYGKKLLSEGSDRFVCDSCRDYVEASGDLDVDYVLFIEELKYVHPETKYVMCVDCFYVACEGE